MEEKQTELQKNNPMHGITLKEVLESLRKWYSWDELAEEVRINCFSKNPSIKSSLTFLRKTDWAREKVERLYLRKIKTNK